jgi:hypothetical protein
MFVSVTRLRLRHPALLLKFLRSSSACIKQAQASSDLIAGATIFEFPLIFWTVTAWSSARPMHMYMGSGAHLAAMPKLREWCCYAVTTHFEHSTTELPSVTEALKALRANPKFAAVLNPSPEHKDQKIPDPRISIMTRFK